MQKSQHLLRGLLAQAAILFAFAMLIVGVIPASAQTKIRIGTQPSLGMIPIKYAIDKGMFKAEGLEVELITLQPGPPVVAALMAGEIDAGWVAATPIVLARSNKLPLKLFANVTQESLPDHPSQWLVTTKASGITSMKDMKGRTVMINTNGGACELAIREHLSAAGLTWDDVKKVIVPFPQMQAALELGNADVACTIDIFYAAMSNSDKIRSEPVAVGFMPVNNRKLFGNGLVAKDDWLNKNAAAVEKFINVQTKSIAELSTKPDEQLRLAKEYAGIPQALIPKLKLLVHRPDAKVLPETVEPHITVMNKAGMLKNPVSVSDLIH